MDMSFTWNEKHTNTMEMEYKSGTRSADLENIV